MNLSCYVKQLTQLSKRPIRKTIFAISRDVISSLAAVRTWNLKQQCNSFCAASVDLNGCCGQRPQRALTCQYRLQFMCKQNDIRIR